MPKCTIDLSAPSFEAIVKNLAGSECPKIHDDLADVFEHIEQDINAAHGTPIPGFGRTIWKYRCKCSDLRRGARDGLRIIAFYAADTNTIYPLFIYLKPRKANITADEIDTLITDFAKRAAPLPDNTCESCSLTDPAVRKERYTDHHNDWTITIVLCVDCIDQLHYRKNRTVEFEAWFGRRISSL